MKSENYYKYVDWDVVRKTAQMKEIAKKLQCYSVLDVAHSERENEDTGDDSEPKRTQTEVLLQKIDDHKIQVEKNKELILKKMQESFNGKQTKTSFSKSIASVDDLNTATG